RRVEFRKVAPARGDRLQHGRHEPLEVDGAEVALLDPGDRRHLAVRASHVLGHEPPHPAQALAPSLGGHVRGLTPDTGSAAHVRLGHAALWAGPFDPPQLDAELLSKPPHERRGPDSALTATVRGLTPGRSRWGLGRWR